MPIIEPDGATPLDPDEKLGLLFPHIDTRGELDQMEQVNVQQGLLWLKAKNLHEADLLNDYFVRELHTKLFGKVWKWAGQYRQTEKNIGVAPHQIAVQIRNLMEDARYWLKHDVFTGKELALRFHHKLVQIHPFPNGNGRHSRIMADAILTHCLKVPPIDWGGRDLNIAGDIRTEYIQALRLADKGDYTKLLSLYV